MYKTIVETKIYGNFYVCIDPTTNRGNFKQLIRINSNYDVNLMMHRINGNSGGKIAQKCLKLIQYNKGNSDFKNKISEIQLLLQNHNPDILCLSEANIKKDHIYYLKQFPNHDFELSIMHTNVGLARNVIIVKKEVKYIRRMDLENGENSMIWIEVTLPKRKKVLVMGGYRQWSLPKIMDINNKKNMVEKQTMRFMGVLESWRLALAETKDTIVLMDDNIDCNPNAKHNKMYKIQKNYDLLQDHLDNFNITRHNLKNTRHVPHQPPSSLDHIYSNCPKKYLMSKQSWSLFLTMQ